VANPSIEIVRGGGWTESLWREAQPTVEEAADYTTDGLSDLGVEYSIPKKGKIVRARQSFPNGFEGLAFDERSFRIHTVLPVHEPWREDRLIAQWSLVAFHEAMHCIRSERGFDVNDSQVEVMANEGLAYVGEHLHHRRHFVKELPSFLKVADLRLNPVLDVKYGHELAKGSDTIAAKKWSDEQSAHDTLRDAELYGAQRVYRQLRRGYALNDLVQMPPEEVLGL
jgi:hypothetical protein